VFTCQQKKEFAMSGFDRAILMEKLIAMGWTQAPPGSCDSASNSCLVPPESLWEKKKKAFYVYDAEALQNLLGESVPEN
jgi:hypothetical protein